MSSSRRRLGDRLARAQVWLILWHIYCHVVPRLDSDIYTSGALLVYQSLGGVQNCLNKKITWSLLKRGGLSPGFGFLSATECL